jgi:hypothetical protein
VSLLFTAAPVLVLLVYAAIVIYALLLGWRKASITSRFLAILLAVTSIAFAHLAVAGALPFELKGGGPEQGKIENGHYFVGNHGRYMEVSPAFFRNTLNYEKLSFWVAMILLASTVAGTSIHVRRSSKSVPLKNSGISN